ncbi:MAG: MBL fold metallo-hydrolase [Pirellulales bacterium]|nr:MBL fold metallo-hydrolase [Pirellulales bacterium]
MTRDIAGKLVFLGTGTSHGVPVIGCDCATCTSANPKNHRMRSSVAIGLPEGNLLIDTTPELRLQLLRAQIGVVHAVLYTHSHADHLFGLDDLRILPRYLEADVPIYCEESVEAKIRSAFDYAFDPVAMAYPAGGVPKLEFRRIDTEPFEALGARITPIRLRHGRYDVLGFRFGNLAYCTDVKEIPPESMEKLTGLDTLILGCLRHTPHVTHMNVEEAIATAERLAPKRTILTHMCHRLEHDALARQLPEGMEPAYDGLEVSL